MRIWNATEKWGQVWWVTKGGVIRICHFGYFMAPTEMLQ